MAKKVLNKFCNVYGHTWVYVYNTHTHTWLPEGLVSQHIIWIHLTYSPTHHCIVLWCNWPKTGSKFGPFQGQMIQQTELDLKQCNFVQSPIHTHTIFLTTTPLMSITGYLLLHLILTKRKGIRMCLFLPLHSLPPTCSTYMQ